MSDQTTPISYVAPSNGATLTVSHDGGTTNYGQPGQAFLLGSSIKDGVLSIATLHKGPEEAPWVSTVIYPLNSIKFYKIFEPAQITEAPEATNADAE